MDWNQPYSCESWATTFGLTYPILDDGSGSNIYGLFGIGTIMFPNNTQTINTIYAFTSGSKINDQDTIIFNIKP